MASLACCRAFGVCGSPKWLLQSPLSSSRASPLGVRVAFAAAARSVSVPQTPWPPPTTKPAPALAMADRKQMPNKALDQAKCATEKAGTGEKAKP